jgi:hypothetical protein
MFYLYLFTPIFGLIKNYVKYKNFKFLVFIRTPLLYFFINLFLQNNIWKVLIYERWFFFIYKSLKSLIKNDYKNKKEKYIKKYGLIYK